MHIEIMKYALLILHTRSLELINACGKDRLYFRGMDAENGSNTFRNGDRYAVTTAEGVYSKLATKFIL
jgi:hypothetical protein